MKRAQRQPVGHHVRTVLTVPAHVGCFKTDWITAQRPVEAAHGALVGVSAQYLREPGPPDGPPGRRDRRAAARSRTARSRPTGSQIMAPRPGVKCRSSSSRAAAASVPGSASNCSAAGRSRPTAPCPASHGPRSGASGPISAPDPSCRSQISRSRWTNGIAARCRPAEALASGGPKSLISVLTGSSASAYAAAVLPVARARPNSHSSNRGLCGARRRARPTGAQRSRASRSRNSGPARDRLCHRPAFKFTVR